MLDGPIRKADGLQENQTYIPGANAMADGALTNFSSNGTGSLYGSVGDIAASKSTTGPHGHAGIVLHGQYVISANDTEGVRSGRMNDNVKYYTYKK